MSVNPDQYERGGTPTPRPYLSDSSGSASLADPYYHDLPHKIETIQFSNTTIDDNDDDTLSLYLGVENPSNLSNCAFPSYRDMSSVSCNDVAILVIDPDAQNNFPGLLHRLLSESMHNDSIMWLPHGRAFAIIDKDNFCANACPLITNTNQYDVFIACTERYGFQQVELHNGHDTEPLATFYHEVR